MSFGVVYTVALWDNLTGNLNKVIKFCTDLIEKRFTVRFAGIC